MKTKILKLSLLLTAVSLIPAIAFCQSGSTGVAGEIKGLQKVLDDLYYEMLPMCGDLISIGSAIAGFAATFYIGSRVWRSIINAEPIDFYPLLRPFVLGFCILKFPLVIGVMNGILNPTVTGTRALADNTNVSVQKLIEKRKQMMDTTITYLMYGSNDGAGNKDLWMQYTQTESDKENDFLGIGASLKFAMQKTYYNLKNWFKQLLSTLLEILFEAAALCINTIRTFNLLILALLGPIVFGLAVFDGFQHTLQVYLARYINYYLWLPVANILGALLGKIQIGMLKLDMQQIAQFGDTSFTTADVGYLIFMIIGIVSYFTIPNIASMIVNVGSESVLTRKVHDMFWGTVRSTTSTASRVVGGPVGMAADAFGDANLRMTQGYSGSSTASGYFGDKLKT
ncbi:conjugative transposon protein TraJ [Chitinophaga sp. CC14]|uniref:conjugative transposon protein TraJ n=1 Tax=Chitinophaga sp. CC14 TaxID=3029199 RepID=UPI003B77630D